MKLTITAAMCLLALTAFTSTSQAGVLDAGDVVIIGAGGDSTSGGAGSSSDDQFAWVPLVDLDPGQTITFTDLGWTSPGSVDPNNFFNIEGAIDFTAGGGGVSAGTLMLLEWERPGAGTSPTAYNFFPNNALGTYSNANIAGESGMLFATTGDNIFIFDGTRAAPNFIYGFRNEGGAWQDPAGEDTANNGNDDSALPASLVGANTALGGPGASDHLDNNRYTGPTTGTQADILAALADPSNWEGSNSAFGTSPSELLAGLGGATEFTILPDTPAAIPEPGSIALLSVAGIGLLVHRLRRRKDDKDEVA